MFGSLGSIKAMIDSLKGNKALLRKKNPFKKDRSFLNGDRMDFKQSRKKITKAPISKEALAQVRQKTVLERKKHFRQTLLLTVVAMPIIVLVVFFAFRDFSFVFPGSRFDEPKPTPSELLAQKKDKYLFYLKDGDNWLQKKKFHNAIFQYRKATELVPSEYGAQYRLALAYSYQCQYLLEGCEEGKKVITNLKTQFPGDPAVDELSLILN